MIYHALQKGFEIGITAFFALMALALCVCIVLMVIALVWSIFGQRDDSA